MMSRTLAFWLACAGGILTVGSAKAATITEVFLSRDADDPPHAVELGGLSIEHDVTMLVLDATAGPRWGRVLNGLTLRTATLDAATALVSSDAFDDTFASPLGGENERTVVNLAAGDAAAVAPGSGDAYTRSLDLLGPRLLVLLEGQATGLGDFASVAAADVLAGSVGGFAVLDTLGFAATSQAGRNAADAPLRGIDGSVIVIPQTPTPLTSITTETRDADAWLTEEGGPILAGDPDAEGYLLGTTPRLAISPGWANPAWSPAAVPEPGTAAAMTLFAAALLRPRRPAAPPRG